MSRIHITLGNKVELAIEEDDHLYVIQDNPPGLTRQKINLGLATDSRFAELLTYIQRLRTNSIKDGPHQAG